MKNLAGWIGGLVCVLMLLGGCGYHVGGKADMVPKNIKSLYIPPFGNNTTKYRLTDRMAAAVTREFLTRTRYRVVNDANDADAILNGIIVNYNSFPTIFDAGTTNRPGTGRASGIEMRVTLSVKLTDRVSKAILYNQPSFEAHERYEVSIDPTVYLEENDAALDRMARSVARQIVSAILENF